MKPPSLAAAAAIGAVAVSAALVCAPGPGATAAAAAPRSASAAARCAGDHGLIRRVVREGDGAALGARMARDTVEVFEGVDSRAGGALRTRWSLRAGRALCAGRSRRADASGGARRTDRSRRPDWSDRPCGPSRSGRAAIACRSPSSGCSLRPCAAPLNCPLAALAV